MTTLKQEINYNRAIIMNMKDYVSTEAYKAKPAEFRAEYEKDMNEFIKKHEKMVEDYEAEMAIEEGPGWWDVISGNKKLVIFGFLFGLGFILGMYVGWDILYFILDGKMK